MSGENVIVQIVSDPRTEKTSSTHPGEPSAEAVLEPLASRRIHLAYPDLVGVSAIYWNPKTEMDEQVQVAAIETNFIVNGRAPNLIILVGNETLSVASSLLCERKDGTAVPRFHFERVALHNRLSQRALVFDTDGNRFEIESEYHDETKVRVIVSPMKEGRHIGHWIQPADCVLIQLPDDPHPFGLLQELLRDALLSDCMLTAFIAVIDSDNQMETRRLFAEAFGQAESMASDSLWNHFVATIVDIRPPKQASFFDVPLPGRGAQLIRAIATKYNLAIPDTYP